MIYFNRSTTSNDSLPMVLWDNNFSSDTMGASSTATGTSVRNVITESTYDYWQPTSLPAWFESYPTDPTTNSAFAIVGHNLYETNSRVKLEYAGASRTNLLLYSEEFNNAAFSKSSLTAIANLSTAPDGTLTADKLVEATSGASFHWIQQSGGTVGNTETLSVYLKRAERFWAAMQLGSVIAYFNLDSGVLGTVSSGATATITSIGEGWYRCSLTAIRAVSTTNYIFLATGDNTALYAGDGTSSLRAWGAQLETGSSATSYIKTTSSAVASTFYDATNWIIPVDNTDMLVLFSPINRSIWRLNVSGASTTMPYIGIFILGDPFIFPAGVMPSYTPIWQAQNVELLQSKSLGGQFMGNRVLRQGAETSINLVSFSRTFAESDLQPFKAWYNGGHAFVWASGPSIFTKDVGYCWRKPNAEMKPTFTETGSWVRVTMEVEAYVQ